MLFEYMILFCFLLWPGDWIVCELDGSSTVDDDDDASQMSGMIQVSSVKALRKKRVRGELTQSYQSHVIINEEVRISAGRHLW